MSEATIEATRELCDDLDNVLELAKRSRAPMRAVTLIELARVDLQTRLDELESETGVKARPK
jgi:hypothetical protein